jgi:hypothetical protein
MQPSRGGLRLRIGFDITTTPFDVAQARYDDPRIAADLPFGGEWLPFASAATSMARPFCMAPLATQEFDARLKYNRAFRFCHRELAESTFGQSVKRWMTSFDELGASKSRRSDVDDVEVRRLGWATSYGNVWQ